jgi:hypothetical protein
MHSPTCPSLQKKSRTLRSPAATLCAAGLAGHAQAWPVIDASNDLLPGGTGANEEPRCAESAVTRALIQAPPAMWLATAVNQCAADKCRSAR